MGGTNISYGMREHSFVSLTAQHWIASDSYCVVQAGLEITEASVPRVLGFKMCTTMFELFVFKTGSLVPKASLKLTV